MSVGVKARSIPVRRYRRAEMERAFASTSLLLSLAGSYRFGDE